MKRIYEQPQIEVYDVKVEQGFAQSLDSSDVNLNIGDWGPGDNYGGSANWD